MFDIVMYLLVGIFCVLAFALAGCAVLLPVYLLVRLWDALHEPSAEQRAEIDRLLAES